jgi:hypothetical protein
MVTTPPNSSTSGPGAVQGGTPIRQQPARQDTPQRTPARPTPAAAATHDPTDVEAAARRLDVLLENDANGEPRKDVPRRGFYLNIVV